MPEEVFQHLRRQCDQLRDDMNELGETLCSFRDIDSESIELMSMKLILLGWHKSKDNDKGERL